MVIFGIIGVILFALCVVEPLCRSDDPVLSLATAKLNKTASTKTMFPKYKNKFMNCSMDKAKASIGTMAKGTPRKGFTKKAPFVKGKCSMYRGQSKTFTLMDSPPKGTKESLIKKIVFVTPVKRQGKASNSFSLRRTKSKSKTKTMTKIN